MRRLIPAGLVTLVVLGFVGTPARVSPAAGLVFGRRLQSALGRLPRRRTTCCSTTWIFSRSDISDFGGPIFGGEYLTGLGDNFDAGSRRRLLPANGADGLQRLRQRERHRDRAGPEAARSSRSPRPCAGCRWGITTASSRTSAPASASFNYHYSETGQFLATDNSIFAGSFSGSGTATGPVILGGVRVPVGSWGVGGEMRYQSAEGQSAGGSGFLREQDRSRRVYLYLHDQRQVLRGLSG